MSTSRHSSGQATGSDQIRLDRKSDESEAQDMVRAGSKRRDRPAESSPRRTKRSKATAGTETSVPKKRRRAGDGSDAIDPNGKNHAAANAAVPAESEPGSKSNQSSSARGTAMQAQRAKAAQALSRLPPERMTHALDDLLALLPCDYDCGPNTTVVDSNSQGAGMAMVLVANATQTLQPICFFVEMDRRRRSREF